MPRQKYFRALNGIFAKVGARSAPNVLLSLINSFCVPLLSYGMECFDLNQSSCSTLESAFSAAFFKIFSCSEKSIIKSCQYYCNTLPLSYTLALRKINFLAKLSEIPNSSVQFLYFKTGKREHELLLNKFQVQAKYANVIQALWKSFSADVSI